MGNLWCCKTKAKKKIVLLLVGLDNAGKTVAAKGLAGESIDIVIPTVGFSIVNLTYLGYLVKVFDLGGGPNIRGIWHKYFVDAHGVIFVVDSSDISRLDEAKLVLQELLSHEKITGKPVLLLANKQDNECALDEIDIIEKLDLEQIVNSYECPTLVQSCTAAIYSEKSNVDPGIKKGYEWILQYISRNYDSLDKRVEEDVAEQTALDARMRKEKIAKIRAEQEAELKRKQEEDEIESYSNYERKLNGSKQSQSKEDDNVILVLSRGSSADLSPASSDFFPPVYHMQEELQPQAITTAVQFVRQQLQELDSTGAGSRKSSFVSRVSNKTAPLFLYGVQVPQSAKMSRKDYYKARRQLKSAGDVNFRASNFLTSPVKSDNLQGEVLEMSRLSRDKRDTPVNGNGVPWAHNAGVNGLSIVEIT